MSAGTKGCINVRGIDFIHILHLLSEKFFIHAENSFTIRLNCVIIARGLEGKEEYKRIKRFLWTDILKFV